MIINPGFYKSVMNYDDRESFFLDNLMDRSSGNPTLSQMSENSFDLHLNVYELFEILKKDFFSDLKVRVESTYRISFYRNPEEEFLIFTLTVPSYCNELGILQSKTLERVSLLVGAEFEKILIVIGLLKERLKPYIKFEKEALETSWVRLNPNGGLNYQMMPIKKTPNEIIDQAYPWIQSPSKYIENYLTSNMPILILSGPPGTGKSTFIRHIVNQAPRKFEIFSVYDEDVMKRDDLYTNFIANSKEAIMIMEDADRLLERRIEDQNTTMSKILNVSDGIIDLSVKKIIFTTNIENLKEVDQALIRPGRCFDILEFRNLSLEESITLSEKIDRPLPISNNSKQTYPISEIFNSKKSVETPKFGF